ncbi:MAG: Crp/Fnr family transcriptional regulator [Chloroflexota bacterium]|nr:Crp/Fnr family transcriptional regulator [Chloroflexota bacterium]
MSASERKKVWYLRHIDLFASMTDDEIEEVAQLLDDHYLPAGAELLGERRRDRVFLIKTGAVRLGTDAPQRQVTFALLGPGRLFGLSSAIGDDDPQISATTLLPSYVCFATWPKLLEVFVQYPQVMAKMMAALAEQVFRAESWRERLQVDSPRHRLATLLVELCDEFGEPTSDGQRIRFRLTQADLARMIGLSRETVNRVMAEFDRCGWVTREGGLLVVRDRPALARHDGEGGNTLPNPKS